MKYITLLLVFIYACTACTGILNKDLANKDITEPIFILSPQNNDSSSNVTKVFWWENVEGATYYNVRIVTPSFANPVGLPFDTNIATNKFTRTLQANKHYEWKIAAKNSSSSTLYTQRSFYTKQADFSTLYSTLIQPIKDSVSATGVNFSWSPIPDATKYILDIDSNNVDYFNQSVRNNSASHSQYNDTTFTVKKGITYTWTVTGYNSTNIRSKTSSTGTFKTMKK